jgi:hypothetical protein
MLILRSEFEGIGATKSKALHYCRMRATILIPFGVELIVIPTHFMEFG